MSKKWLTPEEIAQKEKERLARERARMIAEGRNYAKSDRTDPFTFNRVMSHIDNGVATYRRDRGREIVEVEQGDAFYKASPYREARTMISYDGKPTTYDVVRYMNVSRP